MGGRTGQWTPSLTYHVAKKMWSITLNNLGCHHMTNLRTFHLLLVCNQFVEIIEADYPFSMLHLITIYIIFSLLIYNLTHRRMFTSVVWTDDSKLLQDSNLTAMSHAGHCITLYKQLRVKDLPKVPTRQPEWDSNQRPFGQKPPNPPLNHHVP